MSDRRSPPTRHELMRLKRRIERVRTASTLLSRKRKALVEELFRIARPAIDARRELERRAASAFEALLQAEADRGHAALAALALPGREIGALLRPTRTWGVVGTEIVSHDPIRRSVAERGAPAGSTGPAAVVAAAQFEELTVLVLEAASRDLLARRLARALAETSRRVNQLERRVAPALVAEISRVESTLVEREREEHLQHRRLLSAQG